MSFSDTMDSLRGDISEHREAADRLTRVGRAVALMGVVLPLLFIGGLKFTQFEIDALIPMVRSTPWLAWLYGLFGYAGTSYLFGIVEIATALLLLASRWSPWAGVVGGSMAAMTFTVTLSSMFTVPIWEPSAGGFPAFNFTGSFLIKDVALLGVSLSVLGESLSRIRQGADADRVRRWKSIR